MDKTLIIYLIFYTIAFVIIHDKQNRDLKVIRECCEELKKTYKDVEKNNTENKKILEKM